MPCGKIIKPGEKIYRHVDNVLCQDCHDKGAAHLVPYPVTLALISWPCGGQADFYNTEAERVFKSIHIT